MAESVRFVSPLDRMLYVRSLPPLASLSAADVAIFASVAEESFHKRGDYVLREGRPVRKSHVVVEGRVRVERKGIHLRTAEETEGVGFLELMARHPDGVDAIAETDALTLVIDGEMMVDVFEDHFPIFLHSLKIVSGFVVDFQADLPSGTRIEWWDAPFAHTDHALDLVQRIVVMRRMRPFANASLDALAELVSHQTEERIAPGERIWSRGDPADSLLLVLSGEIRAETADRTLHFGPGVPLGAGEMLADRPRWFDAVAETPVVGLRGYREALFDVLEDHHDMAMDYMAAIASIHIEAMQMKLAAMAAMGDQALGATA